MHGLQSAIDALGVGEAPADGEQEDLFPMPLARGASPHARDAGKIGRPAGSRNKRSREMVDWLMSKYASPLQGLCETWSRTPRQLAIELELWAKDAEGNVLTGRLAPGALLEVFKLQQGAMAAALPYLEQKQPVRIDTGGKVAGMIVLGDLAGVSDDGDGHLIISLPSQEVSDGEAGQSDDLLSDGMPKALTHNGKAGAGP